MERKRIVAEKTVDLNMMDKIKSIDDKVTEIQKNQNPAWLMPVLLLFLTATTTYINYRLQRSLINEDLYKNKLKEKIAEARAIATYDFLIKSKETLDTIDIAFQSYCEIGVSKDEDSTITSGLIKVNALIAHQLIVDTTLQRKLITYTEFVSEHMVTLDTVSKQELSRCYQQSVPYYNEVVEQIDKSLNELIQ